MIRIRSHSSPVFFFITYLVFPFLIPRIAATADSRKESEVVPGVKHIELYRRKGPWAINILEIYRRYKNIKIATALAGNRIIGSETISSCVKRLKSKKNIVAAINGDFFANPKGTSQADPVGLQILNGELISTPCQRSCFIVHRDGTVSIDVVHLDGWFKSSKGKRYSITGLNQSRWKNDLVLFNSRFGGTTQTNKWGTEAVVMIDGIGRKGFVPIIPNRQFSGIVKRVIRKAGNTAIPPHGVVLSGHGKSSFWVERLKQGDKVTLELDLKIGNRPAEIVEAIGGTPRLIRDGAISVEWKSERCAEAFAKNRNPRTAIGFNREKIIIVTVDGRLSGYSVGMSLAELANLMLELKCEQAMNLDGGGSTAMFVRDRIVNHPSDMHERPVANFVLVYAE